MNKFLKQLQAEAVAEGADVGAELEALDTVAPGAYANGDARVWVGDVIVYTLMVAKPRVTEAPEWVAHSRSTQWNRLTFHAVNGVSGMLAGSTPCELSASDLDDVMSYAIAYLNPPKPKRKRKGNR